MSLRVLDQDEFVAKERLEVIEEAIDGLHSVKRIHGLNRLQQAALDALEKLHARVIRNAGAVITLQAMRRPVEVAHAAMEALVCAP